MLEFEISVNICKKIQKKVKMKTFFTQNKENVCEKQPITILVADLNLKNAKIRAFCNLKSAKIAKKCGKIFSASILEDTICTKHSKNYIK